MKPQFVGPEAFRRRLVGLYGLTLMEREGPLHGYGLSERIAQRTDGAWRPGPGSVYPSLGQLVAAGLARVQTVERRRVYTITSSGRALLHQLRRRGDPLSRPRPDLSPLWAEVYGAADVDRFLLYRLRRTLDALESQIVRTEEESHRPSRLRTAVRTELAEAAGRFEVPELRVRRTQRSGAGVTHAN